MNQRNGQSHPEPEPAKPRGRFTGQRLKILRPAIYRRATELLAEPRAQVRYDHICRSLRVSEHTLKAIELAESVPIAERKERLKRSAWRVAQMAADQIEDDLINNRQSPGQKVITFGVMTDKGLLLNNDQTVSVGLNLQIGPSDNAIELLQSIAAKLEAKALQGWEVHALPSLGIVSDSGAETGLIQRKGRPKRRKIASSS